MHSQTPARPLTSGSDAQNGGRNSRTTPARNQTRSSLGGPEISNERVTLPDVQAEQSFTYGSNKTPLLPKQLKARERMTTDQIAETLDEEMNQAEANLVAQAAETNAYYTTHDRGREIQERDERAQRRESRRTSSSSVEPETPDISSRRSSLYEPDPKPRTRRGHSVLRQDGPNLPNVSENTTRTNTPGSDISRINSVTNLSNAPGLSGLNQSASGTPIVPDVSYITERQIPVDTPIQRNTQHPFVQQPHSKQITSDHASDRSASQYPQGVQTLVERLKALVREYVWDYPNDELVKAIHRLSRSQLLRCLAFLFLVSAVLLAVWPGSRRGFPIRSSIYNIFGPRDDMNSINDTATRNVLQDLQKQVDRITSQSERNIAAISDQIASSGKQLSSKIDHSEKQASSLDARIEALGRTNRRSQGPAPIDFSKINYAAESHGAIVDPYITSPTKEKEFDFWTRWWTPKVVEKYRSRRPSEVLRPWREPGDCWCAAPTDCETQLAVLLPESIYPTEVAYEHFPMGATPDAAMAPLQIQIWADYTALSREDFHDAKRVMFQDRHPTLPETWLLAGVLEYRISDENYVQTLRLNGAEDKKWATNKFVFRVTKNYGGQMTCLYRVRVHGTPVEPHPVPVIEVQAKEK